MGVRSVGRYFVHSELAKSYEMNGEFTEAFEQYRLACNCALMAHESEQARSNVNRMKQKMHDDFIRNEYYSEARS